MTFLFQSISVLAAVFFLQNSFAAQSSHPPYNQAESEKAFDLLLEHLIETFQPSPMTPIEKPPGYPAEAESVRTLITADCTIRFRLIETTYKGQARPSQNILIRVEPNNLPQGSYTWYPQFQNTAHAVQSFQKLENGFVSEQYTDSCEEEGCDDNWYVAEKLTITNQILELQQTEPYSIKVHTYTCHF